MHKRARSEENSVSTEYLRRLVERHDVAVPTKWNGSTLTLDVATLGNIPESDDAAIACARRLNDFIIKAMAKEVVE
jgi:hypothetical protein